MAASRNWFCIVLAVFFCVSCIYLGLGHGVIFTFFSAQHQRLFWNLVVSSVTIRSNLTRTAKAWTFGVTLPVVSFLLKWLDMVSFLYQALCSACTSTDKAAGVKSSRLVDGSQSMLVWLSCAQALHSNSLRTGVGCTTLPRTRSGVCCWRLRAPASGWPWLQLVEDQRQHMLARSTVLYITERPQNLLYFVCFAMLRCLCGHAETPISFCCKASGKLTSFSQIDSDRSRPMFDGSPWCHSGLALWTTGRCQNMSELNFFLSMITVWLLNLTINANALQTVRLAFGHWRQGGAVLDGGSSRTCGPQKSQAELSLVPKIRLCSSGFLEWRAFLETRMPVSQTFQLVQTKKCCTELFPRVQQLRWRMVTIARDQIFAAMWRICHLLIYTEAFHFQKLAVLSPGSKWAWDGVWSLDGPAGGAFSENFPVGKPSVCFVWIAVNLSRIRLTTEFVLIALPVRNFLTLWRSLMHFAQIAVGFSRPRAWGAQ